MAIAVYEFSSPWSIFMLGLLVFSLAYQFIKIYPYTPVAPKQVQSYVGEANSNHIALLVSNVLMSNSDYDKLIQLTKRRNPDVLLTLESNAQWENALSCLESQYEYQVKVPKDNRYGMHLYSKYPLEDMRVEYLVADDIPSIHGKIILSDGKKIGLHCLHPRPPSPSESSTSTNRDAELLLVGRELKREDDSILVFGDLNDVAWSRTTRLFLKISGLLDPRRGRGFFNTFNANHRFFRWPLDHIFHTKDFTLMEISREAHIGSDHFPMYTKLNYTPVAKSEQNGLKASDEEEDWAEKKIEKADPNKNEI
ncbi:endonuclease/exonuclease/phosphatase family protein [Aggregatimonas sangjinii]|uniref:endonuclease/exonuclease/phosphatase family protein n=1 Tax=Aggregatimonas sangjinii TaxID=2583587 RepID=UPI001F2C95B2|nr:endonuclease/exonuclease/phosphatase family protein [Aggregatimonas sangjinii]